MSTRFGLIGAGAIAKSYVSVVAGLADATIVGVADVDPDAAQGLAAELDVVAAAHVEELLGAVSLDAVIVCTPPDSHPEVASAAFDAGVAVLCEKPLAISVDAAQRMVAAAARAAVPFTMATKFRFVDDVVRARELVASGALGEIIQTENVFASRVDMSTRWNSQPAVSGGGVLIDNGTHSVDIARYFLGPIHEVMVVEEPRTLGLGVEDSVQLLLRAASGGTAAIDLSWSYDNATDVYLQVYGTAGTVQVGWQRSSYRLNHHDEWIAFGDGYNKIACMRSQLANFCAALRGEEELAISIADAIASVQVIDAAYRSLVVGDWTMVDPVQVVSPPASADGTVA